jgi:hypothetical protein
MSEKKTAGPPPLSVLRSVADGDVPMVKNDGIISHMARRFAELIPRYDLFEINDELYFYDHERKRRVMTGPVFRGWIEEQGVVVYGRFDGRSGMPVLESLTKSDASDVLVQPVFRRAVRKIDQEHLVRLPVVRESGELELLPWGYDARTRSYTVPGGLEYDSEWDVAEAKRWLEKWFGAMPFADERSKAVMIAGLLMLYVRHLPGGGGLKPGVIFEANMQGSGKSLCGKAACAIVLGKAPVSKSATKEEMNKFIEGCVESKVPVIFLDNLKGRMNSSTLDQLITSRHQTFRRMGGQQVVTLPFDAPIFVTGNDLEKDDDAWRRYLSCYLFEAGNPQDRVVKDLLDDDVIESDQWRSEALSTLWAMVRTWFEKGMPKGATRLASFEQFSFLMGGLLTASGYSDPLEKPAEDEGLSPEQADFLTMVRSIYLDMIEAAEKQRVLTFNDMAVFARREDVFADLIGTEEDGRRATIREDKLSGDERAYAVDRGILDQRQLQSWARLVKSKVGQEPTVDGVRLRFGDRGEKRKRSYTLEVIEGPIGEN